MGKCHFFIGAYSNFNCNAVPFMDPVDQQLIDAGAPRRAIFQVITVVERQHPFATVVDVVLGIGTGDRAIHILEMKI